MNCLSIIIFGCVTVCCAIQCKSPTNAEVDWFIIYKLPILRGHSDSISAKGASYFYMDNRMGWSRSPEGIDDTNSNPLYNTLNQIYITEEKLLYTMYSDQPPGKRGHSSRHGHSKGVIAFSGASNSDGFWLKHSLPRFPPAKMYTYVWPPNGYRFGQTFLCVTYKSKMMANIGTQLRYINPNVYDGRMIEGEIINIGYSGIDLSSKGNTKIRHIAKSAKHHEDLYNCILAEQLRVSLRVETWRRPFKPLEDTRCHSTKTVRDITELKFENNAKFVTTKDHSKWAISSGDHLKSTETTDGKSKAVHWVCIEDMNRMKRQIERSGGIACIDNEAAWTVFKNIIKTDIPIIQAKIDCTDFEDLDDVDESDE